jgi:glycosyltransferase involved in cell wall biosynthesis
VKNKILLISKLPPPYFGTTVWTEILLNSELKEIYTLVHLNNNLHKDFTSLGKLNARKIILNIKLYIKLIRILRSEKPDLVFIPISQTTIGFIKDSVFILLCRFYSRRILLILHGSNFLNWFNKSNFLIKIYIRECLKSTVGIVVLGERLKPIFNSFYSHSKIFSVPNGGTFNFPKKGSSGILRLLYLGNLQPSKGIEDVLNALILLPFPEDIYLLDVIGSWRSHEVEHRCKEIVSENHLPVHFHASVSGEKKFEFLSQADIFIFTPREPEGHPFVILEAIAAGLPVISTDQGAITESVIDGKNGFIVQPSNPDQITQKIVHLIKNPEIRRIMGNESRKVYNEKFTEKIMVEKYKNVFDSVLNAKC